jgi:flavin-dependent dehydrogenase
VLNRISTSNLHPFSGIRFIQEDGRSLEVFLPFAGGLGIRRTVLIQALEHRAAQLGAVVRHKSDVIGVALTSGKSIVRTASASIAARLVVAADGLHSPLRRAARLDAASRLPRRFALRQHYRVAPWTDLVEVYADRNGEAVATPVGRDTVSVNFTWQDGSIARPCIASLAGRFPALQARLGRNTARNRPMGAGPMARLAKRRTSDGLVLIGDAAGFVDSISGDGLSIAFNSALTLGAHLRCALAEGATVKSLAAYEAAASRLFRGYWIVTNGLLWLARHPRARAATVRFLSGRRRVLEVLMRSAMSMMMAAE